MGQESVVLQTRLLILTHPEEKNPGAKGTCHEEADEVGEIFFFWNVPSNAFRIVGCDSKRL